MNSQLEVIGSPPWTREELIAGIEEFVALYQKRPIQDNAGGMRAPHMFAVWFTAKKLAPDLIVESGVWRGQSTWLLEQACPSARLISIDINLGNRQYISPKAAYSDIDFNEHDWSAITDRSLVFIDDHQNAYDRMRQCKWFGFKHVIIEDNYPDAKGDCYSLKKAFAHVGFANPASDQEAHGRNNWSLRRMLGFKKEKKAHGSPAQSVAPTDIHAKMLRRNLDVYYEFPPVFKPARTRFNDEWTDANYPTPRPLLTEVQSPAQQLLWDEALHYTWICYAKLK